MNDFRAGKLATLACLALAFSGNLLVVTGCDSRPTARAGERKLRVFATVYAMADLAREIGGKHIEVDYAVESGQSLSDFNPSDALRARMNECDLIIADGAADPWAVTDSRNFYAQHRVVRFDALARKADGAGQLTGLLWLDPVIAKHAADEIARRLSFIEPAHDVYFNDKAKQLKDKLDRLTADYQAKFNRAERRRVMAQSNEFDPIATRFGVDVVHLQSTTADMLSDAQIRQSQQAAREEHIVTLIVRADTPRAMTEDFERRTGFRVVRLDAYGSSAGNGHDSYLALLQYNFDQLLDAVSYPK